MDPAFFATPDEWHAWLAEHHDSIPEHAPSNLSSAEAATGTKPRRPEGPHETPSTPSDRGTRR